jgi:hypothetical protein
VDERVDNHPWEHMFDRLTWGFLFHTMCGKPGFKCTLNLGGSVPRTVQNRLTTAMVVLGVLGLLPGSADRRDR